MTSDDYAPVTGFRFAGMSAGIKPDGSPDLALLVADEPVSTAAVFTQNRVRAAPVELAEGRVERGRAQAILVNSGNANACTGKAGLAAARATTDAVSDALDIDPGLVLPASTGVIGVPLPGERIEAAAPELVSRLSPDGMGDFAQAILTTDRGPKVARTRLKVEMGTEVTLVGIAKGAGMIHPNLATTLAFVVTDAPMHSSFLSRALKTAVERSFNAITVDGETSTNDAVFAMTSSAVALTGPLSGSDRDARNFMDAMAEVLGTLGRMIVADGEGAEHVVRIEVASAPSESAGRMVAESVATSLLVKTAIHGCDPNWGRILSAAGNAGVGFDPSRVEIRFGGVVVVRRGLGEGPYAEEQAREVMRASEYTIRLDLGMGSASAHYDTCDLGHRYVDVNASYRS